MDRSKRGHRRLGGSVSVAALLLFVAAACAGDPFAPAPRDGAPLDGGADAPGGRDSVVPGDSRPAPDVRPGPDAGAPEVADDRDVALPDAAVGPDTAAPDAAGGPDTAAPDAAAGPDTAAPDAGIGPDTTAPDAAAGPDTAAPDVAAGPDTAGPDAVAGPDTAGPDAAGAPDTGSCPVVPSPALVELSPLPGESPPGPFETVSAGGFTDDYVYNGAHSLKVGTRREWGGSIIFFGMADGSAGPNDTNAIDANDTGREVQVALYDPARAMQNCAWNASCQTTPTQCPNSITYLGWNPVQGGNRCNRGSGVEWVDLSEGAITVRTVPLFWNPTWDRPDCDSSACSDPQLRTRAGDVRLVQRVRFVRFHVVELDYTVTNLASLDHAPTGQEFPTVYAANGEAGPDLWRLFNSEGTEIAIDTPANDGFFYANFSSPGGWVTMQREPLDYGVGLFTESRLTAWQGWQLRTLPFNNFRPHFSFGIPALGTVRGRSYLILGSQGTVAAEAQWLDAHLPPFGVLDAPESDAVVSGVVPLHGWALDNRGVAAVELVVDGGPARPLNHGTARPDVCLVWPTYAGCPDVGYAGTLDTTGLTACQHLLEIVARDGDGNARVIARRRIVVSP